MSIYHTSTEYFTDKELVSKLHLMAAEYRNPFLRTVADKLDKLVEEKRAETFRLEDDLK